jgi:aminocarboxymuconate-semialdehyde decarboxylase
MPVIDVHCHTYPAALIAELRRLAQGASDQAAAIQRQLGRSDFDDPQMAGAVEARVALMDEAGIHVQVLSVPAVLGSYAAEPAGQAALAEIINDSFSAACGRFPGRYRFFATLPLPHVRESIAEFERAARLPGFAGVLAPTSFGVPFHDARLDDLYAALAQDRTLLFIHPGRMETPGRYAHFRLENLIGWPAEDSLAVMELVLGQVLDRHPALTVVAPHTGGTLLFLWGRLEASYEEHPVSDRRTAEPPTAYLKRLYYDTVCNLAPALDLARALVGADHLLLGSDYPFRYSKRLAGAVELVDGLAWPEAERALVRGGNFERLLRERGRW